MKSWSWRISASSSQEHVEREEQTAGKADLDVFQWTGVAHKAHWPAYFGQTLHAQWRGTTTYRLPGCANLTPK
jgi:hypothetical protein